jgi:hypothetical protein
MKKSLLILLCFCAYALAEPPQQLLVGMRADISAAKKAAIIQRFADMGITLVPRTMVKDGKDWIVASVWYAQVTETVDETRVQAIIKQVADSTRFLIVLTTDAAGELYSRGYR